jgi:uncharacterized small protein (DUF1192 family)
MSLWDEDTPKTLPATHRIGEDVSLVSADELRVRIGLLQAEITRLEREVTARHAARSQAEAFFQ